MAAGGQAFSMPCNEKCLFGGAVVCLLPENSFDASSVREIPDHQEVFCNNYSDQSLIFDLLEYQGQVKRGEAARYHFHDIADANDAIDNNILFVEPISGQELSMAQCKEAWYLSGVQKVSKFNEKNDRKRLVEIHLGLFRLPNFQTDIVVTMNNPIQPSDESISSSCSKNLQCRQEEIWTTAVFKNILNSLKIVDTSLFT